MRYISVIFILCLTFGVVIYTFYNEDIKNSLPTKLPVNYVATKYGQSFNITSTKKLKLIHFFNPDCPCSKFNTKHIEQLYNLYKNEVEFIAYSTKKITYSYPIPDSIDVDGKMAKLLGVYSTPQAVLLDNNGKLIYRGNYNKSRFCSNKSSEYVKNAIEKALQKQIDPSIMELSGKPYGCSIN